MRYLLIAEKPSLMRSIEDCYENHKAEVRQKVGDIEFIALRGHVCRNAEPNDYSQWGNASWWNIDYPMLPNTWMVKAISDDGRNAILSNIKKKLKECDAIIVATDSDTEGYGIYYLLSEYLHLQKVPALRFVEHSLTDTEILHSLLTMTDIHTDPVHINYTNGFLLRSRADWLYGFNLSRLMTVSTGSKKTVGRVKAPTIKMVYDRCEVIDHFEAKTHYELVADYGDFKAKAINDAGEVLKYEAEEKVPTNVPLEGVVFDIQKKEVVTHCKPLYDLSALQTDAGRAFGYSPQETLDAAQNLYEKYKVLSYPRTQCRFVSTERAKEFSGMLGGALVFGTLQAVENDLDLSRANNKRVVNDAEVKKEAHDALLPTGVIVDPSAMPERERNVYYLVCKSLIQQFLPDAKDAKTTYLIGHADKQGTWFKAEGIVPLIQGYRVLSKEKASSELPNVRRGDSIKAEVIAPAKCVSKPPRRFTQASLASAMENIASLITDNKAAKASLAESKGIGQASTRAKIITEIIKYGYVEEKKDGLYITNAGREYVKCLEGVGISDPMFAANMDMQIKKVQRGEETYENCYDMVVDSLKAICKGVPKPERKASTGGSGMRKQTNLTCPKCKKETLIEAENRFYCKCKFGMPKNFCGHAFTETELKTLFSGDEIGPFDMVSKKGSRFTSKLKWDFKKDFVEFAK